MAEGDGIYLAESSGRPGHWFAPEEAGVGRCGAARFAVETGAERLAVMFPVNRRVSAAIVLVVVNATLVVARSQEDADLVQSDALCVFEERIGEYAALHRTLAAPRPLQPRLSAHSLSLRRAYLADAIRKARPVARQGEIFTPEVARLFRGLIAQALTGRDPEAMLLDLFEDQSAPPVFHLGVYDSYPDWATHEMPMILLQWLPRLPADIEYRLVDHDLVLWDAHADLILDVLPDAIPRPSS